MNRTRQLMAAALAVLLLAAPGFGAPSIQHDPVKVAEKGRPMGVRATVRDAGARVESVSLFYATSRGMSPFRTVMSSSGAGVWFASIPGHMVGPGAQLLYYIQAENADGETMETDWQTVRLVESGIAPEAIPAASDVARQARQQAVPAGAAAAPAPAPERPSRAKYLVPAAVIVGGAVAVGGAFAIAESSGGGGGGGSSAVTNANFGGDYSFCFEPDSETNSTTVCDSGLVNVYVRDGTVEVIGLWGADIFSTVLNGSVFSISKTVPATAAFPESRLVLSGEIRDRTCTVSIDGYSQDMENPGSYTGTINTTKR